MEHPDIHPQPGALVNGACLSNHAVVAVRGTLAETVVPLQPARRQSSLCGGGTWKCGHRAAKPSSC